MEGAKMDFHIIKSIKPLENMILEVVFLSGETKKYDTKALIKRNKIFKKLENEELFNKVKVDVGGYGIAWDEDIDLSSKEIWKNGY